MKPVRTLFMRAIVGALLFLALYANTASADPGSPDDPDGGAAQQPMLPEDPGIE